MRFLSSPCRPVISASATTSAMTPTATPMVENKETREMEDCWRRASRYRRAINNSNGTLATIYIMNASSASRESIKNDEKSPLIGGLVDTLRSRFAQY